MFEIKEAEMTVPPTLSSELRKRIERRRMATGGLVAVAALSLLIGGYAGARSLSSNDAVPVPPAEEKTQEREAMRNGRIVQAESGSWQETTAPPPPGGERTYYWDAFDQDTGAFLFADVERSRVWVVDEDGTNAEFVCPASSDCGSNEMATFGPDPDEITVPSADRLSVHIIGFDGTLRDTLDISTASFSPGQDLVDLAWSPGGDRLAVSTEPEDSTDPERGCDRSSGPCGSRVWIFDRDGGEPQQVYTERDAAYTVLRDLAWSPDGDTLALLAGPPGFCEEREMAWPRLVALRVSPDGPVGAETLHVYDDYDPEGKVCIIASDYHIDFPFAWSPDATRIAVSRADGIAEISAETGEVVARHADGRPAGTLAWLPKD
jgi:hypothetical protein